MRDYQVRGLNWMISLYENGINGILADEMVMFFLFQFTVILCLFRNQRKLIKVLLSLFTSIKNSTE